jgi:high affinity Mn2+ porin
MKQVVASIALVALGSGLAAAQGAGRGGPAPVPAAVDWSGLYAGGQVGYGLGGFGAGSHTLPLQGQVLPHSVTGLTGGYQAGVNWQTGSGAVIGLEGDIVFMSPIDRPRVDPAPYDNTLDYVATFRGRFGHAFGSILPYVTGGLGLMRGHVHINDADGNTIDQPAHTHYGWVVGAGVEAALGGPWSAKLEYNYLDLGARSYRSASYPALVRSDPQLHLLKLGLNYRLGDVPGWPVATPRTALPEPDWSVHGQTTVIAQGYPRFRAPYQSDNSLPSPAQGRETWTVDAFLGWRLWDGGEFYFNPELAQGFGIGSTLGLAGFSNGEAQKGGAEYPRFRAQRYYLKQTFGFGGGQEEVADGPMQLSGKRDIDRLSLVVGRFAVGDFFDGNSYAKDPRADFMNWSMWASAAYDFPADLPGFTRGAVAEYNRRDWAIRAGLFQVPAAPNSDVLTFRTGGTVVEFEERHTLFGQPGKLRLAAFANKGNTARYRDALGIAAVDPAIDVNTAVGLVSRENLKYGFYANLEQQLMTDVGLFARASWNDGQAQILSFTDIDRSVSAGLSVKGSHWGRPTDTFGIGGAVNGLSAAHRDFLAAGGLGLLIGDGRLSYGTERILETYYAYAVNKALTLTADYQLIVNPAYNTDRGPVSIFSARMHAEF